MDLYKQPEGVFGITLDMAQSGQEYIVKGIYGGCRLRRLLMERGLTEGERIKLIKGQPKGPIIIEFRSSRIMLDGMCARKIIVGTGDEKEGGFMPVVPCEGKGKRWHRGFRGPWRNRHGRKERGV